MKFPIHFVFAEHQTCCCLVKSNAIRHRAFGSCMKNAVRISHLNRNCLSMKPTRPIPYSAWLFDRSISVSRSFSVCVVSLFEFSVNWCTAHIPKMCLFVITHANICQLSSVRIDSENIITLWLQLQFIQGMSALVNFSLLFSFVLFTCDLVCSLLHIQCTQTDKQTTKRTNKWMNIWTTVWQ